MRKSRNGERSLHREVRTALSDKGDLKEMEVSHAALWEKRALSRKETNNLRWSS